MSVQKTSKEETGTQLVVSLVASAAFLLLFVLIIWLTYLPTQADPIGSQTRQEQEMKLRENKAAALRELEGYSVVNRDEGIYRIPIDLAMELTVRQFSE